MRRPDGTYLPGHSPGRPKGARNKLQSSFLYALAEDFEAHGADAIKMCRMEEPGRYVQIVASLMPKELDIESRVAPDLDDEQLDDLIAQIRQHLLAGRDDEPVALIDVKPEEDRVEEHYNRQAAPSTQAS
jgi:hypothetical protein